MFIGSQSILGVRQSKVDEGGYMAEDGVCASYVVELVVAAVCMWLLSAPLKFSAKWPWDRSEMVLHDV